MTDLAEILRQVRRLEIRSRRMVDSLAAGRYRSRFKGQGMEFEDVREYSAGDDIRHIDWNVTARSGGRAFIKTFREEREIACTLLVDVSASMQFGSIPGLSPRHKINAAAEAAAIVGVTAMQNNDLLGLVLFSNQTELQLPGRKGRGHTMRLIRECLSAQSNGRPTKIVHALEELMRTSKKRQVCFLVSDFLSIEPDLQGVLTQAARRHDIVGLRVSDPGEASLPATNTPLVLVDPESQREQTFAVNKAARRRYQEQYEQHRYATERLFRNAGCDLVDLATNTSCFTAIQAFFNRRRSSHHG